ncbi:hypothetical protein BJ742DRAFT_245502 [Cladochytrium replicatum]|nr:hypothetical protein BJ742DRAFT_245502 [Cladochytrium replicatum]
MQVEKSWTFPPAHERYSTAALVTAGVILSDLAISGVVNYASNGYRLEPFEVIAASSLFISLAMWVLVQALDSTMVSGWKIIPRNYLTFVIAIPLLVAFASVPYPDVEGTIRNFMEDWKSIYSGNQTQKFRYPDIIKVLWWTKYNDLSLYPLVMTFLAAFFNSSKQLLQLSVIAHVATGGPSDTESSYSHAVGATRIRFPTPPATPTTIDALVSAGLFGLTQLTGLAAASMPTMIEACRTLSKGSHNSILASEPQFTKLISLRSDFSWVFGQVSTSVGTATLLGFGFLGLWTATGLMWPALLSYVLYQAGCSLSATARAYYPSSMDDSIQQRWSPVLVGAIFAISGGLFSFLGAPRVTAAKQKTQ